MTAYQLIFQVPDGAFQDFDSMIAVEDELIEALSEVAEVDGHDTGSGTINFFVHADELQRPFELGKGVFEKRRLLGRLRAAYRSLDENKHEDEYINLWPKNAKANFELMNAGEAIANPTLPPWIMFLNSTYWRTDKGIAYSKNWIAHHEADWNKRVAALPAEVRVTGSKIFDVPAEWIEFRKSFATK